MNNINSMIRDYDLVSRHLKKEATHLRVSHDKSGEASIKQTGVLRRCFYSVGYRISKERKTKHEQAILDHINKNNESLNKNVLTDDDGYNNLFNAVYRYNYKIKKQAELGVNKSWSKDLNVVIPADVQDLEPAVVTFGKKVLKPQGKDKPKTYTAKKFSFKHPFKKRNIRLYPTDITAEGKPQGFLIRNT